MMGCPSLSTRVLAAGTGGAGGGVQPLLLGQGGVGVGRGGGVALLVRQGGGRRRRAARLQGRGQGGGKLGLRGGPAQRLM